MIAGFRIEAVLRSTPEWIAYEATQISLRRRVELVLHDDHASAVRAEEGARRQALLHHRAIIPVFESGWCDHGQFVARRLVRGGTLAEAAAGPLGPSARRRLLDDVASALDAAHAAGLVHGSLSAHAVLVEEGRAFLTGLVVPEDAREGVARDRRDYAGLLAECLAAAGSDTPAEALRKAWPQRSRRRAVAATAAAAVLVAAAALILLSGPSSSEAPIPQAPGSVRLGSALAPGPAVPRDCEGRRPDGNSRGCTLVALDEAGRPVAAPADGVVRAWAVRGAQGMIAAQVLRRSAGGRYGEAGRSQFVAVRGPRRFSVDLPVRQGDHLGLELQPGASVAVREGGPGRGALSWIGPLEMIRAPRREEASAIRSGELLVRFDFVPGARPQLPRQVLGDLAEAEPSGTVLETEQVETSGGRAVEVSVVRVDGRIVLDLVRGGRRLSRMDVPDADPRGDVVILEQGFTEAAQVRLQWRNRAAGPLLVHGYSIGSDRLEFVY